eukprot:m.166217 g.166217  ORF g.166217 m.166217 type:complete len:242 (-) comp18151_c0_seq2:629-1354(-)
MGAANAKQQRLEHASKTGILALENLKLQKVPNEVSTLDAKRLRTLSLAKNVIQILPDWLCRFTALKTLDLQWNRLSTLPDLSGLVKLEVLNLSNNGISTIPHCVFNMKSLKTVNLSRNRLGGVAPEGFSKLQRLGLLDLSYNKITAFAADCHDLNVHEINLNGNRIAAIPAALSKAKNLKVLRLDENCLEHQGVPGEFLKVSSVSLLSFDGNPLLPRQFQGISGHDEYEKRFTASKQKMRT